MGGCTLTGALAVTTSVTDGISIVHGPAGCAHHNFSLFFSTALGNDEVRIPAIASSCLSGEDVIFGGEDALEIALDRARSKDPGTIFVLTSCVAATIGDDVAGICAERTGIPVVLVPTEGFLGGDFRKGFSNALIALSDGCRQSDRTGGVNIIGEKNLDSMAEIHYREVRRLLAALGLSVNIRFVRNIRSGDIPRLGCGCLNILRDTGLSDVGEHFEHRLGIPALGGFPAGLSGTIRFLESAGECCDLDWAGAVLREESFQREMIEEFMSLSGHHVRLVMEPGSDGFSHASELAGAVGLIFDDEGSPLPVPSPFPVGTTGCRRLLHRWRCAVRD
ncbi:MAG: nitrogenase component 1 [Methanoregulaceae archaeon]|nr:nitrogenase component 1 [Methanoregulaceae archaeon]